MKIDEQADLLAEIHESMASGVPLSQPLRELDDPDLLATVSVMRCLDRAFLSHEKGFRRSEISGTESNDTFEELSFSAEPIQIGRFRTVRLLGYGGCGIVLQAFDTQLLRFVALKFPRDDQLGLRSCRDEFLREAQAGAILDHPMIVPVYEMGDFGGTVFIVTGHVDGIDLASWLNQHGNQLSLDAVRDLMLTLANTVNYMHSKGILHCDLKPGNILMVEAVGPYSTKIGDRYWTPKITDFGLARTVNPRMPSIPIPIPRATRAYMAPELASGRQSHVSPATDVYLLGAVLYELLRRLPRVFGATAPDFVEFTTGDQAACDTADSAACEIVEILRKCIAQRPELRYGRAAELANDLEKSSGALSPACGRISQSALFFQWICEHRRVQRAAVTLGLAISIVLVWNFILGKILS